MLPHYKAIPLARPNLLCIEKGFAFRHEVADGFVNIVLLHLKVSLGKETAKDILSLTTRYIVFLSLMVPSICKPKDKVDTYALLT